MHIYTDSSLNLMILMVVAPLNHYIIWREKVKQTLLN